MAKPSSRDLPHPGLQAASLGPHRRPRAGRVAGPAAPAWCCSGLSLLQMSRGSQEEQSGESREPERVGASRPSQSSLLPPGSPLTPAPLAVPLPWAGRGRSWFWTCTSRSPQAFAFLLQQTSYPPKRKQRTVSNRLPFISFPFLSLPKPILTWSNTLSSLRKERRGLTSFTKSRRKKRKERRKNTAIRPHY